MDIHIEGPIIDKKSSAVCETILRALPDWFGIEEALIGYVRDAAKCPALIAWNGNAPIGILVIHHHNPYSSEIHVMGVLPEVHRCGVGRALILKAEAVLRESGVEYLQVKTLAAVHPDAGYAITRNFYQAVGFRPLEVLPQIWDENNPCLIMVKALKPGTI